MMKTITIDGEEYRTLDDHEAVPIVKLASEDGYKILKKVEKPVSPLKQWQDSYEMGSFSNAFAASTDTANWLVDTYIKELKNECGDCENTVAVTILKRLIGR